MTFFCATCSSQKGSLICLDISIAIGHFLRYTDLSNFGGTQKKPH